MSGIEVMLATQNPPDEIRSRDLNLAVARLCSVTSRAVKELPYSSPKHHLTYIKLLRLCQHTSPYSMKKGNIFI